MKVTGIEIAVKVVIGKVGEEFYGYNRFWDERGFLGC